MYKKSKKLLVWCLVVAMVLTQMLFTNMALAATPNAGVDRYETAAKVAQAGWTTSDYAVLAYGEDFPDALAAAPLAAAYNAPILLTDKTGLNSYTKAALTKLGVKNVIVVGGEGVVPAAVVNEVAAMTGMATPTRVFGTDRVGTALAIAKAVETKTGKAAAEVFAVNSEAYADALSISSLAAMDPVATIVLVGKDEVNADVAAYVSGKKVYAIGGTGVISDAVKDQLKAERITEGTDRYGTNLAVLKAFDDFKYDKVFVATGENYPDALAGSVYAAKSGSPLVLVDQAITTDMMTLLKSKMTTASAVYTLGGLAAVANAASALENAVVPSTLTVTSVSALNLNQIKVVFNKAVDEDTAEDPTSYILDGAELTDADSVVLQSDDKTVVITLDAARDQYEEVTFVVKKAVMSENLLETAPRFEKDLTFSDTTVPTVKSVTVSGNSKLTVEFSEAVDMTTVPVADFKVNDQVLVNYGFTAVEAAEGVTPNPEVKDATDSNFASKIAFTFDEALPTGTNTLTVPEGTDGEWFADAAHFLGVKSTVNFTVSDITNAPKVVSVTGENNGTIYVTYDRSMKDDADGEHGANNAAFYRVNGSETAPTVSFKEDTDNKVVKLEFAGDIVEKGANILTIDGDIQDTYGNSLDEDEMVRESFTATEDTTAPTVSSVTMLDNETIRVKFNETVDHVFAAEIDNYTLKNSSGSDKSSYIDGITAVGVEVGEDSDTYDIALNTALTSSGYTLKIENIYDLAATPNCMEEYTATVNGDDDQDPTVKAAVAYDGSTTKVTVYFSEAMNSSDISNKANYAYGYDGHDDALDGTYAYKALPSGASISAASDNKSVTITFPSSFEVEATPAGLTEYYVHGVRVANVKDTAGNTIDGIVVPLDVVSPTATANNPVMNAKSSRVYMSGTTLVAEVQYDRTLTYVDKDDFEVAGEQPDSASLSGSKVILKFTDATKKANIKRAGIAADIAVVVAKAAAGTKDAAGVPIYGNDLAGDGEDKLANYTQTVYDDQIAPVLLTKDADAIVAYDDDTLVLTFSEDIDPSIAGLYKDDFTFVNKTAGKSLTVEEVNVSAVEGEGNKVIFTFKTGSIAEDDVIAVKAVSSKISIKDMEDAKEDQNAYVPSSDDVSGYDVTADAVVPEV